MRQNIPAANLSYYTELGASIRFADRAGGSMPRQIQTPQTPRLQSFEVSLTRIGVRLTAEHAQLASCSTRLSTSESYGNRDNLKALRERGPTILR
jgi:hypothetical protein